MNQLHIYISYFFLLVMSFTGTAQDLNWYENSGIETNNGNTLTGNAQVLSLEVLPEEQTTGFFEITNFKVDGNNIAGFLETRYSDVTIYLAQNSDTNFNNFKGYSIVISKGLKNSPEFSYRVVAKRPDGSVIGTLTDVVPKTSDRLRIEKINATQLRFSFNSQILGTVTDSNISWLRAGYAGNLTSDTFPPRVLSCTYSQQGFIITDESYGPFSVTDTDKNWISVNTYGITENPVGNLTGASVSYYDDLGKITQSQTFNKKERKTWASEIRYDAQGRPAVNTLTAPIGSAGSFTYKKGFIKKAGNVNFNISDYEKEDIENPTPVSNQEHTLGWYYSNSNNSNRYQDITNRPYSRTIYSKLNPTSALKTIGGNKIEDEWKQDYVFSMLAGQELSQSDAFGDAKYNEYKIVKTVSRDVHGVESVVFTDTDGRTLATARSGNEEGGINSSRTSTVTIGDQKFIDIHIPVGLQGVRVTNGNFGNLSNNHWFDVFDLVTEEKITTDFGSLPSGFYRISYVASGNPVIKVSYPENYYDYSLNEYDKAGRLIASYQPLNKLKTEYEYDALGQIVYTKKPDEGEAWFKYRTDGQIRFSRNSKQKTNAEFSYTHYDQLGRPVESGIYKENSSVYWASQGLHSNLDRVYSYQGYLNDEDFLKNQYCSERHMTAYDVLSNTDLNTLPVGYKNPAFLSGNVAKTWNDNTTTYYSYDAYRRVQWMVQNIAGLGIKTIDYEYDPKTSQVKRVLFQKGKTDQFIHRYTYDPIDYSLTKVETSTNGTNYKEHASYRYTETGELEQLNLAEGLQKIDYVYTLNGALKSINTPSLTTVNDSSGDPKDLFGMEIHYYDNDYNRTGTPKPVAGTSPGINQYNGNIKAVTWNTYQQNNNQPDTYYYSYDKNNWLTGASFNQSIEDGESFREIEERRTLVTKTEEVKATKTIFFKPGFELKASSSLQLSGKIVENRAGGVDRNGDYNVYNITYDANGNIQTLNRNKNKDGGSNAMDKLSYHYKKDKPNQLSHVDDAAGDVPEANDIDDQDENNYEYNGIGQLVYSKGDNVSYVYNVSGLVTEIKKGAQPLVKFFYNDKNYRVKKESYNANTGSLTYTEHYVRDASGITMAIYRNGEIIENTIYGTSRLGVHKPNGTSLYQLTDHLGNVRAVLGRASNGQAMVMTSASDYYPFGMPMPNRQFVNGEPYRYAYQGQEKDLETGKEAFQLRLWDSRIGRWLTVDPYGQYNSPYVGMGNNPISQIDPDGGYSCPDPPCDPSFKQIFWDFVSLLNGTFTSSNSNEQSSQKVELVGTAGRLQKISELNQAVNNLDKFTKTITPNVVPDAIGINLNAATSGIFGLEGNVQLVWGLREQYGAFVPGLFPEPMVFANTNPMISTGLEASSGVGFNLMYYEGTRTHNIYADIPGPYETYDAGFTFGAGVNAGYSRSWSGDYSNTTWRSYNFSITGGLEFSPFSGVNFSGGRGETFEIWKPN
ncbi:RHS repeat-associated core domain-containing protein [Tenacibaculum sp. 190524A05c]|uniref:RHS repeat domain-containing protein n=1 Tax=Tenacibaculum platacis TaxID=3137852 RepID=UPI0031FA673F